MMMKLSLTTILCLFFLNSKIVLSSDCDPAQGYCCPYSLGDPVTITAGVTTIPFDAFKDCTTLVSITIPDIVTTISYDAFLGCSNLVSVKLGNGLQTIGDNAFAGCTSLISIILPSSITSLGHTIFTSSSLKSITMSHILARTISSYHHLKNTVIIGDETLNATYTDSFIGGEAGYTRICKYLGIKNMDIHIYDDKHIDKYTVTMSTDELLYKIYKPNRPAKMFGCIGSAISEADDASCTPLCTPMAAAMLSPISPGHDAGVAYAITTTSTATLIPTTTSTTSSAMPTLPTAITPTATVHTASGSDGDNDQAPVSAVVNNNNNNNNNKVLSDFKFPGCSIADPFYTLGMQYGTDKVTHHGYHRFYPIHLAHYQTTMAATASRLSYPAHTTKPTTTPTTATTATTTTTTTTTTPTATSNIQGSMLEIGIHHKSSLKLWLEYFPHAYIYGIDISINDQGNRYKIIKCDQSDSKMLKAVVKREIEPLHLPMFFIIDDGSHIPEHQSKYIPTVYVASLYIQNKVVCKHFSSF